MKQLVSIVVLIGCLAGCGAETASSAATAASIKTQDAKAAKQALSKVRADLKAASDSAKKD